MRFLLRLHRRSFRASFSRGGNLQRAGLIHYSRGHIEVLDRSGLEKAVCECYAVVKMEFDRLLPDIPRCNSFHTLGQSGP